jgi:hypothetical protein
MLARFQIHSAPSPTITTTVCAPTQPNSRSCPCKPRKISSASPNQVTRNRRTTERRPGEFSTRSCGIKSTPVLTSRNCPFSTFKRQLPIVPPVPPIPSNPPLPPWFWKPNFPPPKPDEWKRIKKEIKEALHLKNIDLDTIIDSLKDAISKDPSNGGWTDDLRQLVDELDKARREGNKEWWKDDDDD